MHTIKTICPVICLFLMSDLTALAGPPYLTDDPDPTDYQHWETYLFTQGQYAHSAHTINGPAAEANYGLFPDTQFSVTVPMTTTGGEGIPEARGLGDILIGLKYRFIHETNGWPQVALYPQVTTPTGDARLGLGNGRPTYLLPLWVQKSWGPWTTYGGGGELWNPVFGRRDYPIAGWLLQRDLTERLTLGGEIYAQGQDTDTDHGFVALNLGGSYKFTEIFSLVYSAGHSVVGDRQTLWYFGLNFDW
jgi:hypothetical protein